MNNYQYGSDWVYTSTSSNNMYFTQVRRTKTVDKGPGIDENGIPVDRRLVEEPTLEWEAAMYA